MYSLYAYYTIQFYISRTDGECMAGDTDMVNPRNLPD